MNELRKALKVATEALVTFKKVCPHIIFFRNGLLLCDPVYMEGIPDTEPDANSRYALIAGIMAKRVGADMVILIWDAAMRAGTEVPSEEEMPLCYPKSMRHEVLIAQSVMIPSGESELLFQFYSDLSGEIELKPNPFGNGKEMEANCVERFSKIVLKGYNYSRGGRVDETNTHKV
jgi:hypothetical protein